MVRSEGPVMLGKTTASLGKAALNALELPGRVKKDQAVCVSSFQRIQATAGQSLCPQTHGALTCTNLTVQCVCLHSRRQARSGLS